MTPQNFLGHSQNNDRENIGKSYELEVHGGKKGTAILYHHGLETERVDLSDIPAKRLFIVRLVERKVNQTKLAKKLNISRQSIHNYVERKEHFGLEGLINSYHVSPNTSLQEQRKENLAKRPSGNLSRKLEEIRKKFRIEAQKKVQDSKPTQLNISFIVEGEKKAKDISSEDQRSAFTLKCILILLPLRCSNSTIHSALWGGCISMGIKSGEGLAEVVRSA
jgi:transposase